jgi:hypothetical protein
VLPVARHLLALALLSPSIPAAQQPPPRAAALTPAEARRWRADLRYLAAEMPRRHANLYHSMSRAEFITAVRRLDARIPSLRREQVILELARLAARVGDGHTNVAPARDAKIGFHAIPLRLYWFADGLYIRAADSTHAGLVGARVRRLGRATVDQALSAVAPLIGRDNDMGVKFAAPFLLVMPEVLHGLGLTDDDGRVPAGDRARRARGDRHPPIGGARPAHGARHGPELGSPGGMGGRARYAGALAALAAAAGQQVSLRVPRAPARALRPAQRGGQQAGYDAGPVRRRPVRVRAAHPVDRLVLDCGSMAEGTGSSTGR